MKQKTSEINKTGVKKIIVKIYKDFPFELTEIEKDAKMYKHHRLSNIIFFKDNPENRALAQHHNKLLEQIEELQDKLNRIVKQMK